ncbi:MAG TPA: glycosyltransferase, partial [Patescibacteria group bacterium]
MKICILAHTFPFFLQDSTAAFMHPLVEGIQTQKNSVFVLLPYTEGLIKESFPYPIITYKYIYPKSMHTLGFGRSLKEGNILTRESYLLSAFLLFFGIISLYKLCRKQKIDIVSAHWVLPNGLIAFVVSKILNIPYTVSLPGSDVYISKKNKLFSSIANIVINNASEVISDSPTYIQKAMEDNSRQFSYSIIPYPVNIKNIRKNKIIGEKIRKKLLIPKNKIIILCVARLIKKKGIKYFIDAVYQISKLDKNIEAIIVGDGDLKEELQLQINRLHMENKIIFTGNIDRKELPAYYNAADIFV